MAASHPVIDNPAEGRYEVHTPTGVAMLTYARGGGQVRLLHTEVPAAAEGQGIAAALARFALEEARGAGLSVVPVCPYVAAFIERNPEYRPLLAR